MSACVMYPGEPAEQAARFFRGAETGTPAITAEVLRLLLHYNPYTGIFTWRVPQSNRAPAGKPAGTRRNGYVRIRIAGKDYNAHRLAWLYMYGVWPEKLVDHINGRRDDNRFGNLRELSNTENQQNRRRAARHSSTGLIGVSQGRREGTFRAHITLNRERQFLGNFSDPLQAQQAYINAKRCLHPFGTI